MDALAADDIRFEEIKKTVEWTKNNTKPQKKSRTRG